jgi:hypothetical protein
MAKGRRVGRWRNLKSGDREAQAGGTGKKAPTLAQAGRHQAGSLGRVVENGCSGGWGIGSICVSGGIVGKYYENLCKESGKSAT